MRTFFSARMWRKTACAILGLLSGCSLFSKSDTRLEPSPLTAYEPGMAVHALWTAEVGNGSGLGFMPSVVGDAVYAATPDGSVGKFDLRSGRPLWHVSAHSKLSAGVGSDGTVAAVVTVKGEVIAFEDNGKIRWKVNASSDVTIPPVVGDGVVVVRNGDYRIQAFNINTGELVWSMQRPGPALALRAPAQMIMAAGLVITGLPGGKLLALQSASGKVQWEGTVATPHGASDLERLTDVVGAPRLAGSLLCAVAYQGRLVCFDVSAGGRPVWTQEFSSASGIAVDDHYVYAATQQSVVSSFALQDGSVVWKQDALKNRLLTAPVVLSGAIAMGDLEGYVHFLSRTDGHLLARLGLGGGPIISPLQTTSQGVLVQTGHGKLVMIGT